MKKLIFFGKLLIATVMGAPFTTSAQVTIGSGDIPQATLDVRGSPNETGKAFRLIDGNQAPGKVLTVGEDGIATWENIYYTPVGGAIVNTIIELAPALQADWSIDTQRGVRVGSVCQIRIVLQYNGTDAIAVSNNNASEIVTGGIMARIIDDDFRPLDTSYTTGYAMRPGGTSSYATFTNAITASGNILFRHLEATEIVAGDRLYMTAIYIPANFNE